jgi:hypothetical protein
MERPDATARITVTLIPIHPLRRMVQLALGRSPRTRRPMM